MMAVLLLIVLAVAQFNTNRLLGGIMATQAEFTAALDRVFSEIAETAQLVRDLKDQLANGGLSGEEEAAVIQQLGAAADALDAIQNPVEPPVE